MSAERVNDQVGYTSVVIAMSALFVLALAFGAMLWASGAGNAWLLVGVAGICPVGVALMHVTRSVDSGTVVLVMMAVALPAALMTNSSI